MKSVRTRLTLFNMAIVVVTLTLMGWALRLKIHANLVAELDRTLEEQVGQITTTGEDLLPPAGLPKLGGHPSIERTQDLIEVARKDTTHVKLESKRRLPRLILLGTPEASKEALDPSGEIQAEKGTRTFQDFIDHGEAKRSFSLPVRQDGKIVAVVQSVLPLAPINREMNEITAAMVVLLPLAALLAAVSGTLLVGSAMRPLRRITESARVLEDDLSGQRLPTEGNDEFSELALAFNDAFDRTSLAFKTQQAALDQLERFTGNAAHELRTPLTTIKGGASYLLHMEQLPESCRASAESIDRSSDRMIKLIGDLLLLAKRDSGCPLELEDDVDLGTLVQEACEDLIVPSRMALDIEIDPSLRVRVDPGAFQQVVSNLVRNAVDHACAHVLVTAYRDGQGFTLKVSDDGEGISTEHLARLGERFYRVDSARARQHGGTGLGLAIAKAVCEAHGGELRVESVVGEGTIVWGRFGA